MSICVYPTYKLMVEKTKTQPAYRGTPDRHPLGDRRSIRHYFVKREEGGQTVFDICYDYRHKRIDITKDQYDEIIAKGNLAHEHNGEYFRYERDYNPIVRIRPDDTTEFVAENLWQGNRMFLANWVLEGYVFNDSRRGGVVFRSNDRKILAPIYKGLRVDRNFQPMTDVAVMTYKVDRKKSKALVKSYENGFKVAEVMFSSMTDKDTFAQAVREIGNDHLIGLEDVDTVTADGDRYMKLQHIRVKELSVKLLNDAPLDALVLSALHYDIDSFRYMLSQGKYPQWSRGNFDPAGMFMLIKRKMINALYQESPEIFKPEVRDYGAPFPPTAWGVSLIENGKDVEQYGYSAS